MGERGYNFPEQPAPLWSHPLWAGCIQAHVVNWGRGAMFVGGLGAQLATREDANLGKFNLGPAVSPDPPNFSIAHAGRCIKQDLSQVGEPLALYEDVNSNARYHPPNGVMSIMVLLKPREVSPSGTSNGWFGKATSPSPANQEYSLGSDGTNDQYRFYVLNGAGSLEIAVGGGPQTINRFKLLVGTYDGSDISLWVDGERVDRNSAGPGITERTGAPLGYCMWGTGGGHVDADAQFAATAVWQRPLSDSECLGLWTDPFAMWRPPRRDFFMGPGAMGGGGAARSPDFFMSF